MKTEKLSEKQIHGLVEKYFRHGVEILEERTLMEQDKEHPDSPIIDEETLHQYVNMLDSIKHQMIVHLGCADYSRVEKDVDKLLEEDGFTAVKKGSSSYRKLSKEVLKAQLKEIRLEKQYLLDGSPSILDVTLNGRADENTKQTFYQNQEDLISEVITKYVEETKVKWTPKTKDETLASLKLFIEVVGDVPIQSINRRKAAHFKEVLVKLPVNRKKDPKFRNRTLGEILKMKVPKTLSPLTVAKRLQKVVGLFNYAIKNGMYEGPNPASNLEPPKNKRAKERRAAFTREDLVKLFHSDDYLNDSHKHPFQFWMPILALLTGARQNELAQLHIEDIRQAEDGVWVFDINDEGDKRVKNNSSKRIIPIHPFLLEDLKLLSYVEKLKKQGEKRLFPELPLRRDGYGRKVGNWFNGYYKGKCGIVSTDGRLRDFHSFRATFITNLVHNKVNKAMMMQVDGHADAKDMTSVYAEPYTAPHINPLRYQRRFTGDLLQLYRGLQYQGLLKRKDTRRDLISQF